MAKRKRDIKSEQEAKLAEEKAQIFTGSPQVAISVLVPIYNTEKYLRQALDSLVGQSFKDFEVLCINDGSTDGSRAIIQEYLDTDSRFRVIDKDNSGYGASMNRGIREARGEYIAILEPDDFFESNALELLYGLASCNDADVAKANYWFYWSKSEKNQLIEACQAPTFDKAFDPRDYREVFFTIPSIWSAIYRRSMLLENRISFLETAGASYQDMGFQFKVWCAAGKVVMSNEPILHYRQDNESSSVNDSKKAMCVVKELNSCEQFIQGDPDKESLAKVLYRLRYDSYMWNFARLGSEGREEFFPRMHKDLQRGMRERSFDKSLFGKWQEDNLRFLLGHPKKFQQLFPDKPNKANKAAYYLAISGPKGVLQAMRH